MRDHFDVVVIGAGAAGIAALRTLLGAGVDAVALEARERVGGRAHTLRMGAGFPVDCGAAWVHSADINPLSGPIAEAGFALDSSPPHWMRQAANEDFPAAEQRAFRAALQTLDERVEAAARTGVDRPVSELFEPGGRWNVMLDAFSSYYNGAEFEQVSLLDYAAYEDSGVNWRVREGYGAAIAAFAPMERIVTGCAVTLVRHDGPQVRLETPQGTLSARAVIVTVPTPLLANGQLRFEPGLPAAAEAAAGLPLGLADKVFLGLDEPEQLPVEGHLFGSTTRTETGSYHLRPVGRPYIEVFLGGRCARTLEGEGEGAMAAFAVEELVRLLGADIRAKLHPLGETRWAADPWAMGSYSHALPGRSAARTALVAAGTERIAFAGEACHPTLYSTVHGAWASGEAAAAAGVVTRLRR
jgi:monoamine oxidase